MRTKPFSIAGIALGLLLAVHATPADAQGRGNGKGNGNGKRPAAERPVYEQYDDREYRDYRVEDGRGRVPPGWCKGKGNPHNTPENCGYRAAGRYDDRYSGSRSGSYQRAHEDFHYYLDRKYGDLAARRPLDLQYQLRLRLDKKAEHDRWHARAGVRH